MFSDTTSEDNAEFSSIGEPSFYEDLDMNESTYGGVRDSDLSFAYTERFFSLPRVLSPSTYKMDTGYLLIGDFTCWYILAIIDLPVNVSGIFPDSIEPSRVNGLLVHEWGEHTLPYVSHEVSTFFI